MAQYLSDFPPGPLDNYRKQASFEWKQLKVFLDTEEGLEFKKRLYDTLQKYPVWLEQSLQTPTMDEIRRVTVQKMFALTELYRKILYEADSNVAKEVAAMETFYLLDPGAATKYAFTFGMFYYTIRGMGTKRHEYFHKASMNGDVGVVILLGLVVGTIRATYKALHATN